MTAPPAPSTARLPPNGSRALCTRRADGSTRNRSRQACSLQQLPGDDQLLHFAGALVDSQRTDVSVETFDGVPALHARPAPQLHRGVDDALSAFGGGELGHGGLARDDVALVAAPRGAVGEQ